MGKTNEKIRHTPGPWHLQEIPPDGSVGEMSPSYRITGETTLFLDVVECSDGYVPGQNEANARLIAAAPDLLAACKAVLDDANAFELCERCRDALESAIAKAEGEA